jgi:hypothetical protein
MRKLIFPLVILSVMMFACNIQTTVTPTTTTPSTVTQTPELSPVAVTDTPVGPIETPTVQTNTTCNELSVYLDPALASDYTCETIPESPEGIATYPQYTKLTLQGYPLTGTFFTPYISILPIKRYIELLPDFIPGELTALQTLIGGEAPGDKDLPLLPTLNAAEMFHAQYKLIPFTSGNGIRYMTLLAQFYAPINNKELFYTYQGLTQDGKYWISAILPINNPILPANGNNPPGGQSWDQFTNDYSTYIADLTNQLNSQVSGNFTPSLDMLDALVASITIQP